MRRILQIITWTAFAGTIAPPVLYLLGHVELPAVHTQMLAATLVWFVATPLWMGREDTATTDANSPSSSA